MRRLGLGGWIVTLLWRLHPRRSRGRFSSDLEADLQRLHDAGRTVGWRGVADAMLALARAWGDVLVDGLTLTEGWGEGTRSAVRTLRRSPGYAALVVGMLALSLGANTGVFAVAHAALFKTLPYAAPEQVYAVTPPPIRMSAAGQWSVSPDFASTVASAALYIENGGANLTAAHGDARRVSVAQVSDDFFQTLGVEPALGPGLTAGGADDDVVISHRLWAGAFASDPAVVGRRVALNGRDFRVSGILPPGVDFPVGVDVWVPFPTWNDFYSGAYGPYGIARLNPGQDPTALADVLSARVREEYAAANAPLDAPRVRLRALRDELEGSVRLPLLILLGVAGVVALLGCLNLAGVTLARTATRAEELSVRRALGASGRRIVTQILVETLVLATLAGVASLLAALWASRVVLAFLPGEVPGLDHVEITPPVLIFAGVGTVVACILVGLVPALHGLRLGLAGSRGDRRATTDPAAVHAQSVLVVAQVALTFCLVAAAGLLGRSLAHLQAVPLGFATEHVLTFGIRLPSEGYPDTEARRGYADGLVSQLSSVPGVEDVGLTDFLPLSDHWRSGVAIRREGSPESDEVRVSWIRATPGYLDAMGFQVLSGRPFPVVPSKPGDLSHVVLPRVVAAQLFGEEDAAGRTVLVQDFRREWHAATVDAVVADIRLKGAEGQPSRLMLTDFRTSGPVYMGVAIRASGNPLLLVDRVHDVARSLDPSVPAFDVSSTAQRAGKAIAARRAVAILGMVFAGCALLVAAMGLHALVAHAVTRRRREMGIRIALGARADRLVGRALAEALKLGGLGLAIGLGLALAVTKVLDSLLFGVPPRDPWVLAATAVTLTVVATLAAYLPARRITALDPTEALREE